MSEQQVQDKHREIKIIREVNIAAENSYEEAVKLGGHAAKAFQERHRSQMTNLETLAESALKVTDIFDYIKRQTARYSFWRHAQTGTAFGEELRSYLEKNVKDARNEICNKLNIGNQSDEEKQLQRHIYLQLIRQFIRQMVIQYEYRVSFPQQGRPR
jgi:hypothetical protein